TWREAQEFCRWLSAREGRLYRLPTEAEWEYACKAGTTNRLYWGDDFWNRNLANTKGWKSVEESWADDGHKFTAPVGCYPANPWGLFDMVGNVREWVQDWHGPFPAEPQVDPQGPHLPDRYRVMKGSGWMTPSRHLSCSNRDGNNPADLHDPNGFRILCEIEEASPPPRP
ncbi:MAG TPA: SUMF1/EgtB/PvdO family nonheme iron enzyme, partial [Methylomirabilota bacterium]|nr:SUMF1/EgtB/PvdO family nonheme iron enzyme [Methylomirabilota bacterium]